MRPAEYIFGNTSTRLMGKTMVLAVTGSIAAVKAVEIARELIRQGANVIAVLSQGGGQIIHSNSLEYATGKKVITQISGQMEYLDLFGKSEKADLLLVCPATADAIGKITYGFADDIVSLMAMNALGSKKKVLIVPAMHESMGQNKIVQENIRKLKKLGVHFLDPVNQEGIDKLPGKEEIVLECERLLLGRPLNGKKVVIASGRTEEDVDDVRVLTNRASGRMGNELALEAYRLGARVVLVHCNTLGIRGIKQVKIRTALEMENALLKECEGAKYLFMPAAIGDFNIQIQKQKGKISSKDPVLLTLKPRRKIIQVLRKKYKKLYLVGFKLVGKEKELEKACFEKLRKDRLQMVVGDTPEMLGAEKGKVIVFKGKGILEVIGSKTVIAYEIWKEIVK
jgi:phosphopantothenoylcysteine decarboxylase / phosphopantothenate---cysteine ligase